MPKLFCSDSFITASRKSDTNWKKNVVFIFKIGRNILCYLHSNRISLFNFGNSFLFESRRVSIFPFVDFCRLCGQTPPILVAIEQNVPAPT